VLYIVNHFTVRQSGLSQTIPKMADR